MDLDSTTLSTARKIVPDLYFAHFLLVNIFFILIDFSIGKNKIRL